LMCDKLTASFSHFPFFLQQMKRVILQN